jgi:hypothetical protein
MPGFQQVLKDPEFGKLAREEQIAVLSSVDPEFGAIAPKEQGSVLDSVLPAKTQDPPQEATPYPGIEGAYGDNPTTNIPRSAGFADTLAAIPGNLGRSAVQAATGAFNPATYEGISKALRGGLGISPEEKAYYEQSKEELKQSILHPINTFANDPVGTGLLAYGAYKGITGLGKKVVAASKEFHAPKTGAEIETAIADKVKYTFDKAVRPSVAGKATYSKTDKYYKSAQGSVESIINNKGSLELTDPITGMPVKGTLPETLGQYAEATEQAKAVVFKKYDDIAKGTGKGVDTYPIADELRSFAGTKEAIASGADMYALRMADRYEGLGSLTLTETQNIIADLNRNLKAYDRTPNPGQVSNAGVDALVRNNLRKSAESAVNNSQYVELKKEYGNLLSAEKEINQRALVDARKNIKGFFDLTDVYTAKELALGVLKGDPARLAGAAAMNATKMYLKYMNSPNRLVKKMFTDVESLVGKRAAPAGVSALSFADEAAALPTKIPVKYIGEQMGYPMFQQETPGVGSFIKKPDETVAQAFERALKKFK